MRPLYQGTKTPARNLPSCARLPCMFARPLCTESLKSCSGVMELSRPGLLLKLLDTLVIVAPQRESVHARFASGIRTHITSLSWIHVRWTFVECSALVSGSCASPYTVGDSTWKCTEARRFEFVKIVVWGRVLGVQQIISAWRSWCEFFESVTEFVLSCGLEHLFRRGLRFNS